jgi:cobalt-zinc-cadmium efflux system protein
VGGFVLVEGARRLLSPPEVASGAMLAFGVAGLAANLLAVGVLAPHRGDTLNTRAAFLEVVSDLLGSVAVVVAALVVLGTGWDRADAVASLVIAGLIVPRTVLLLRETGSVLMESTPPGLDLDRVRADILQVPHVLDVHDLHATLVATGLPVLTAHVVVDDACFEDGHVPRLLDQLQAHLAAGFDVAHSTFQFEPAGHAAHEEGRHA